MEGVLAENSRDEVVCALVLAQLEFGVYQGEQVSVAVYLAGQPTLLYFELVLTALETEPAC